MNFLISIVVPVYNVENYIERFILSLINQTYKHLETLLVDYGFAHNSGAICDLYAAKYNRKKVCHIANGDSNIARNYTINRCTGDYISFVDSDDWKQQNMYIELVKFAVANNLKVVETNSKVSNLFEQKSNNDENIKVKVEDMGTSLKRMIQDKIIVVCGRLYHTSILRNRFFIEGILILDVYCTIDILNEISEIGYFENSFYLREVKNPKSVARSPYSKKKLDSISAAEFIVKNTQHFYQKIKNLACQYSFQFLISHYDALYLNAELNQNKIYRYITQNKIRKYHHLKHLKF